MNHDDPLAGARALANHWQEQGRKGKGVRPGYLWCNHCGRVELPTDGGDLCDGCIPIVNAIEARHLEALRKQSTAGQGDEPPACPTCKGAGYLCDEWATREAGTTSPCEDCNGTGDA